jgi:hypothetical protein
MLKPILEWLLRAHCANTAINVEFANSALCARAPKGLAKKIAFALEAYPCDYLFVHRDAEGEPADHRRQEIHKAVKAAGSQEPPCICVIPIRMTEAWLLFDEPAIRSASGNPNGKVPLEIPALTKLEVLPDPKRLLHELLITASELTGRRRRYFDARRCALRVAGLLDDFSPLRRQSAFQALEDDIRRIVVSR